MLGTVWWLHLSFIWLLKWTIFQIWDLIWKVLWGILAKSMHVGTSWFSSSRFQLFEDLPVIWLCREECFLLYSRGKACEGSKLHDFQVSRPLHIKLLDEEKCYLLYQPNDHLCLSYSFEGWSKHLYPLLKELAFKIEVKA